MAGSFVLLNVPDAQPTHALPDTYVPTLQYAIVFHFPIGWLNAVAFWNIELMLLTDVVFTTSVTNLDSMFQSATAFNQPIGNWTLGSAVTMASMFRSAIAFNQPIGGWDMGSAAVTEPLEHNWTRPSGYPDFLPYVIYPTGNDVIDFSDGYPSGPLSNSEGSLKQHHDDPVGPMCQMFYNATAFNQPIGNWKMGSATDMRWMFYTAVAFNQPIGNWNMTSVTSMDFMFESATAFNQPIGNWTEHSLLHLVLWHVQRSLCVQPAD